MLRFVLPKVDYVLITPHAVSPHFLQNHFSAAAVCGLAGYRNITELFGSHTAGGSVFCAA